MTKASVLFVVLAMFAGGGNVLGEPVLHSFDGTLEPGVLITVAGASFGPKETATPILFEDFQQGPVGASLTVAW